MGTKGYRHITTVETIAVSDLLKLHTKPVTGPNGEKLVEYNKEYSDDRIAAMVAGDLSPASVAKVRQDVYGKLFIRGSGLEGRVAGVEQSIEAWALCTSSLRADLAELTGKYNKLVETMSLNKVADVRHLKIKDFV